VTIVLHHADAFDVLAGLPDQYVDVTIADPPYSERTHAGRRTGNDVRRGAIGYDSLTNMECQLLAAELHRVTRHFVIVFGDHTNWDDYRAGFLIDGGYAFAPVVWVKPDAAPRFCGDGPASSVEWLFVGRRKSARKPGSLPGYYLVPTASTRGHGAHFDDGGAKPLALMRRLVVDYSLPGDTVLDPFAGSGTTLVACAEQGRQGIGVEKQAKWVALAQSRVDRVLAQGVLPGVGVTPAKQGRML